VNKSEYIVVGLMSGTSLDGLDLILVRFSKTNSWQFEILKAKTVSYSERWQSKLQTAYQSIEPDDIQALDIEYGNYLGQETKVFIDNIDFKIDFVASHGHTIFHKPDEGITKQIGNGKALSEICGLPVIYDFRSQDVSIGGQGAPLVPIGDQYLFGEYSACINLGGFANISFEQNGKRIAYDICPVNIVLNYLTEKIGKKYDKGGEIAAESKLDRDLFQKLNALPYYQMLAPKSLGREWVEKTILPLLAASNLSIGDQICTFSEHAAKMISASISALHGEVLMSGGGVYNTHIIKRIKSYAKTTTLHLPSNQIIDFKEALIFAFMGVLRSREEINVLRSVTGASRDSCAGELITIKEH
jgi:anhydro-N-acetylmuramic acid kinase